VWWHCSDLPADHFNNTSGSRVEWIQYADRVHQFQGLPCSTNSVHTFGSLRSQLHDLTLAYCGSIPAAAAVRNQNLRLRIRYEQPNAPDGGGR
jgi:hypothetical protein